MIPQVSQVLVGYGEEVAGRGELGNQIAKLVGRALKEARDTDRGDRVQIAERMGSYLGRTVSVDILNKWASEGSVEHRIPYDAFVALVDATGAHALLGFMPRLFGFAVIPAQYADVIELHILEQHERAIADRKAALLARVKGAA